MCNYDNSERSLSVSNRGCYTIPGQGYLECLVAGDERCQFSERLFTAASDSHQQGVASRSSDDTRYLDQMSHGVLEEDQIHVSATDGFVVLPHEHQKSLLQLIKGGNLQKNEIVHG